MTTVRQGDRYDITLQLNADLTGATVRANMRRQYGDDTLIPFDVEVTDPGNGIITHTLTGTLEPDTYLLEVEVTRDDEIITFPTDGATRLRVIKAIG